jgi:hypothetical protein
MVREIGNLKWMNFDEAVKILRPENQEKKIIIEKLFSLLKGFFPVIKNKLDGKLLNENNTGEQQKDYVYRANGAIQGNLGGAKRFFGTR